MKKPKDLGMGHLEPSWIEGFNSGYESLLGTQLAIQKMTESLHPVISSTLAPISLLNKSLQSMEPLLNSRTNQIGNRFSDIVRNHLDSLAPHVSLHSSITQSISTATNAYNRLSSLAAIRKIAQESIMTPFNISNTWGFDVFEDKESKEVLFQDIDGLEKMAKQSFDKDKDSLIITKATLNPDQENSTKDKNSIFLVQNAIVSLISDLRKNFDHVYNIDPREFEKVVAELLKHQGFTTHLTKATRDGGKDIIAISNDLFQTNHIIECKRHKRDNKVSVDIVRQLLGVMSLRNYPHGVIVTTSTFSKPAIAERDLVPNRLSLHDFNSLQNWISSYTT